MMKRKCSTAMVTWIIVAIGAINWGLVGLGNFFGGNWDLIQLIFRVDWLENILYIIVGIAGVMSLFHCKCKKCNAGGMDMGMKHDAPAQGGQQMGGGMN